MDEEQMAQIARDEEIARQWDEEEGQRAMSEAKGNYKISDFKGMSYNEIRPVFEKVWDFNQHIEPMDLEHGSERMKSPEKIEEEDDDTQKEMKEMEEDAEKEDLKAYLDIVPREDVVEDVESLSTKYPIVDWKTSIHMLTEKKYPLSQEMITKMLNKILEVDHESTQAYELLKFIRSQVAGSRECLKKNHSSDDSRRFIQKKLRI
ncbi:hypothetical protein Tco_0698778 [Tanacetum coccineum]